MKKKAARLKISSTHIALAILALLIMLFLIRGWIRKTFVPAGVQVIYGNSVQNVYQGEVQKLSGPLEKLGPDNTMIAVDGCRMLKAEDIRVQVECGHEKDKYLIVEDNEQAKKDLKNTAVELHALLKANGWSGEYDNNNPEHTSLVKLFTSIANGIDYQPDAYYEKRIGDVSCWFDANTAFSQPSPAAVSAKYYCGKTFNFIGEPRW